MIDGLETLFCTISFIVPGFVWQFAYSLVMPMRTDKKDSAFNFLTLSCVNYAIWSWLIALIISKSIWREHYVWSAIFYLIVTFISPFALGLLFGKFSSDNTLSKILNKIGINPLHPFPTSWDYFFAKRKAVWVLVTLINGAEIAGLFNEDSFASDGASERDIYISEVYQQNGSQKPWSKRQDSMGVLIKSSEIRSIEFFKAS